MQWTPSWESAAGASWSDSRSTELLWHKPMSSGNHLHGDREHPGVGREGHAGCEHHLLTVTVKGTVIRAPSWRQGKGNVYLFVGFLAYGREIGCFSCCCCSWFLFIFCKERQESIFIVLWDLNKSWNQTHPGIPFQPTEAGLLPLWDFRNDTSSELDSETCSPGRVTKWQGERGHFQPGLRMLSKSPSSAPVGKLGTGWAIITTVWASAQHPSIFKLLLYWSLKMYNYPWTRPKRCYCSPFTYEQTED